MANCRPMGFDFGLHKDSTKFKRKFRWLFKIDSVSADDRSVSSLPPSKGARPSVSFKEIEVQHLNETIFLPGKPEWKTINLTLFDIANNGKNPVFDWLKKIYDPESGSFISSTSLKKPNATLELYDGCGQILEEWKFESIWPQTIEFGELDMDNTDVITCDITLRYDRSYLNF